MINLNSSPVVQFKVLLFQPLVFYPQFTLPNQTTMPILEGKCADPKCTVESFTNKTDKQSITWASAKILFTLLVLDKKARS